MGYFYWEPNVEKLPRPVPRFLKDLRSKIGLVDITVIPGSSLENSGTVIDAFHLDYRRTGRIWLMGRSIRLAQGLMCPRGILTEETPCQLGAARLPVWLWHGRRLLSSSGFSWAARQRWWKEPMFEARQPWARFWFWQFLANHNLSEPVLSKYRRKYYISEFGEV